MQTICKNMIFLLVKKIFETLPTQNVWRYLPQRDKRKRMVEYCDLISCLQVWPSSRNEVSVLQLWAKTVVINIT